MKEHQYFVYIMASMSGTLYSGVCNDIRVRVKQHKEGKGSKFTSKYGCTRLVYYEGYRYVWNALERE